MIETQLVQPQNFALYVGTGHGFWLGMICFFLGFILVSTQEKFWGAVASMRWITLGIGFTHYLVRLLVFRLEETPNYQWLTAFESMNWMLAILGFASLYLNKSSPALSYLSTAVYPVYIVHMPVLFLLTYFLLPLTLPASLKLVLLTMGTFGLSMFLYEFVLRRIKWIRPLFGIKLNL